MAEGLLQELLPPGLLFPDVLDQDLRQLLAMSLGPAVALPALHLEHDDFVATEVFDDLEFNLGPGHDGSADLDSVICAQQQDAVVQVQALAGLALEAIGLELSARFNPVLFAACLDDRVHEASHLTT